MKGEKLSLRLFLQGVEFPCVSASVQINIDAPAACIIQTVPIKELLEIKPRTGVEVFFWNDVASEYSLLFSGEVIGVQYKQSHNGSAIILQAMDDSSYWDTAYQYYVDWGRGVDWLFRWKANFVGAGQNLFDSLFNQHSFRIQAIVSTPPLSLPEMEGLAGGVVHLLEAVGGISGQTKGMNDFFTAAELQRKLLAQISAAELDDTSARIFGTKVFWQWLLKGLSSAGSLVTVRDMIKLMFRYVFHNVVPNPVAKLEGKRQRKKRIYKKIIYTLPPALEKAISNAQLHIMHASQIMLEGFEQGKPKLAELFRKWYRALVEAYHRNWVGLTDIRTAISAIAVHFDRYTALLRSARRQISIAIRIAADEALKAKKNKQEQKKKDLLELGKKCGEIKKLLSESISGIEKHMKNFLRNGGEWIGSIKRDVSLSLWDAYAVLPKFWQQVKEAYIKDYQHLKKQGVKKHPHKDIVFTDALFGSNFDHEPEPSIRDLFYNLPNYSAKKTTTKTLVWEAGERLHNQIIRPDIWFAAPPRCNVLFPDDYDVIDFGRSFLKEPTRFELTTSMFLMPPSFLTKYYYYAPNIKDVSGKYYLRLGASQRMILPHETYTGIIPSFTFLPNLSIYAAKKYHQQAIREEILAWEKKKKEVGEKKAQKEQRKLKALSIGIAQRSANFLFFKQRFSSRQLAVTSRFLPRLVCGFPALIVGDPTTERPSFLGTIVSVQHNVSQQGGSTQLSLTDARLPFKPDDEYLSIEAKSFFRRGKRKGKKKEEVFVISTRQVYNKAYGKGSKRAKKEEIEKAKIWFEIIIALKEKKLKRATFLFQRVAPKLNVIEITKYGERKGESIYAVGSKKYRLPNAMEIFFVRGKKSKQKQYSPFSFSAEKEGVKIPFEELVYPSWVTPIYRSNILAQKTYKGKQTPYYQFFGTTSILPAEGEGEETSIEEAIAKIISLYKEARKGDVHLFIDTYTARPIASLEAMMGKDVEVDENGKVIKGREGFRTLNYTPLENFKGLPSPSRPLHSSLDTRKEKKEKVMIAFERIQKSRGIKGG